MVHMLQKISQPINRKPIESQLAFQAKGNNRHKHIFALEIIDNAGY